MSTTVQNSQAADRSRPVEAPLPEKAVRAEWVGLVALLHEVERIEPRHLVHSTPAQVDDAVRLPLVARVSPLLVLLQSLEAAMEIEEPEIASICFVARTEVRTAGREAERAGGSVRELLVACDVLRTRMLNAIEAVIASRRKVPTDEIELADGRGAARARALYARLKDVLADAARLPESETTRALSRIAVALATMATHEDYRDVRLSDRFVLESLYRRILAWGSTDAPSEEGGRLLLDAVAMSGLLETVNKRPSLVRHDRTVVAMLLGDLSRAESDEVVRAGLDRLRGRHPEVDAILVRFENGPGHPVLRRVLRQRLTQLDAELAPPPEPPPSW